jgi:hypothetical protein
MKIISQEKISQFRGGCSNLFNSYEWLKVISKTYQINFSAIIEENAGFILPFCHIKDRFYPSIKSIPFGDYTLNSCNDELLNAALQLIKSEYPESYIETSLVKNVDPLIDEFNVVKYGYLIQIDIKKWKESRDWKEAYERNIRNALNYGLAVKINTSANGLENFYRLHEQLRIKKFNKLPQPIRFFSAIHDEFIRKNKGFLLEAWDKSNLIASWLILEHKKTLYYKFGASDIKHLYLRPNDLLFRSLMQYGSDKGFKTIDLGFSGATKSYEGLIRFKSKEGGVKIPIYRVERYPEDFDYNVLKRKSEYLSKITQTALESKDLSVIRKTSDEHYGEFA